MKKKIKNNCKSNKKKIINIVIAIIFWNLQIQQPNVIFDFHFSIIQILCFWCMYINSVTDIFYVYILSNILYILYTGKLYN